MGYAASFTRYKLNCKIRFAGAVPMAAAVRILLFSNSTNAPHVGRCPAAALPMLARQQAPGRIAAALPAAHHATPPGPASRSDAGVMHRCDVL
jgi:hypothetical protein